MQRAASAFEAEAEMGGGVETAEHWVMVHDTLLFGDGGGGCGDGRHTAGRGERAASGRPMHR